MNKIYFGKSTDPLIYNGSLLIFKYIDDETIDPKSFNVYCNNNELSFSYENYDDLKKFFQCIVNRLENNYIRRKNKDFLLNNDNKLELIDRLSLSALMNFFIKGVYPTPIGASKRVKIDINSLDNDQKTEYDEKLKKLNKDARIYRQQTEFPLMNLSKFKNKNKCDFCDQCLETDKINKNYYPFTASLTKYRNFNSNMQRSLNICIACALSCFVVYRYMPFVITDSEIFFSFPVINSNKNNIWNYITSITGTAAISDYTNFSKIKASGTFQPFIELIYYLNDKLNNDLKLDIDNDTPEGLKKSIINTSWFLGHAKKNLITNVYTYSDTYQLFNLINQFNKWLECA